MKRKNQQLDSKTKVILDEEKVWDKKQLIISKTDKKGTIVYTNNVFENTSEYSSSELLGKPHNIIRHPDMPKIPFKLLWNHLKKGENFHVILKNLTKSGRYYWVITDFTVDKNEKDEIIGYTAHRKAVPNGVVEKIEPIYKKLLEIEKIKGEKASELYFNTFLNEEIGKTYDEFVINLFEEELLKEKESKGGSSFKKTLRWFFLTDYYEEEK